MTFHPTQRDGDGVTGVVMRRRILGGEKVMLKGRTVRRFGIKSTCIDVETGYCP